MPARTTPTEQTRTAYRTCPLCEATCGVAIEIESAVDVLDVSETAVGIGSALDASGTADGAAGIERRASKQHPLWNRARPPSERLAERSVK